MIDLHTHTTASDGRCTPEQLAARAAAAGVTVLGLTDHDTMSGCPATAEACVGHGIEFVHGIEITAVADDRDIHILGYLLDPQSAPLQAFLAGQRQRRVERVREMLHRLSAHGLPLDADAVLKPGLDDPTRAAGRPWVARAMVAAGYVRDVAEAFDVWLSRGRPGFVPRTGAGAEEVIARVHEAGGIASLAHPVLMKHDEWIPRFADAGLDAIEAYHSDHDETATLRYLACASRLGLMVTGGSDYHADEGHGGAGPGSVALPREHYDRLIAHRRTPIARR